MARRLDKIEKEIGYCEIKLEKERRLRKQAQFLRDDQEILDRLIGEYTRRGAQARTVLDPSLTDVAARTSRDGFLAVALVEMLREERDIMEREQEDLQGRLATFTGFESKRAVLEEEKRNALKNFSPLHSSKLRKINEDFKKTERHWNAFTEDLVNLDEGIFFLDRNLDYLRSCRALLISAKGNFDIDRWTNGGSLSNLFRHSNIGRAKDMADGADRNLKMAQKELMCVTSVKMRPELLQRVLLGLLEALFGDIFVEGRFEGSFQVVEAALSMNIRIAEQAKMKRLMVSEKLLQIEKARNQLFSRLGADRRGRLVGCAGKEHAGRRSVNWS